MKLLFLSILFFSALCSHPHTFIDVHPTINFKDNKTTSIHIEWVFDEMTSAMLIMEVDEDGDGEISPKESEYILKEYVSVFEDFGYYMYIKSAGKLLTNFKAVNFTAHVNNHKISYSFDIQGEFDANNTIIEFGDSDYYIAMVLKKEFVKVNGALSRVSEVDNDSYYGYRLGFE